MWWYKNENGNGQGRRLGNEKRLLSFAHTLYLVAGSMKKFSSRSQSKARDFQIRTEKRSLSVELNCSYSLID